MTRTLSSLTVLTLLFINLTTYADEHLVTQLDIGERSAPRFGRFISLGMGATLLQASEDTFTDSDIADNPFIFNKRSALPLNLAIQFGNDFTNNTLWFAGLNVAMPKIEMGVRLFFNQNVSSLENISAFGSMGIGYGPYMDFTVGAGYLWHPKSVIDFSLSYLSAIGDDPTQVPRIITAGVIARYIF